MMRDDMDYDGMGNQGRFPETKSMNSGTGGYVRTVVSIAIVILAIVITRSII